MSKIFVVCPSNVVTGGTELLHQLVHELRHIGHEAYISYWPFNKNNVREPAYLKYDAPINSIEDLSGNKVIFPESLTLLLQRVKNAECAVWWLSVDHYFGFPQNHRLRNPLIYRRNRLYDPLRRIKKIWRTRLPFFALRAVKHFTQSYYAKNFLEQRDISASMLTDYLSEEHFTESPLKAERQDIIVYNPKKGMEITSRLIAAHPNLRFVPIENMTPVQVAGLLRSSKLYIDFGNHPGKDRPPREAVIAGCCVITGQSGAAAFEEDIPIPKSYRLDPYASGFLQAFEREARLILKDYPNRSTDFDAWRDRIRGERILFKAQVRQLFG